MYKDYSKIILGTKLRARHKELIESLEQSFTKPIIHRGIHGEKVYVPLDLSRIWDRIN